MLGTFVPAAGVPGSGRTATPADLDVVLEWLAAFMDEALPGHAAPTRDEALEHPARAAPALGGRRCAREPRRFHEPVGGLGRIGPVYTPPEHRGHGYAAAVTTLASRRVLDAAARPMLHTTWPTPPRTGSTPGWASNRSGR